MGFFSSMGENLFASKSRKSGVSAQEEALKQTKAAGAAAQSYGAQFNTQRAAYDKATADSMGANATDYLTKAQTSAKVLADEQGKTAAKAGTRSALQAARSVGLSKGQAALSAGQQAGDIYSNNYTSGLQNGINNYGQATSSFAGQGSEMAGRQQNALATQMGAATGASNIAQNQITNAQNKQQQTWGTIGTVAGTIGGMMSDEEAKKNVQEVPNPIDKSAADVENKPVPEKKKFDIESLKTTLNTIGSKFGGGQGGGLGGQADAAAPAGGMEHIAAPARQTDMSNNVNAGINFGKTVSNTDKFDNIIKAIPSIAGSMGKMSDERAKTAISEVNIDEIAKKIRPVKFEYRDEIVAEGKGEPGEHVGVIAQDLVETPLASAVKEGEDGYLRIDTAELSPAILNLVIQLARKVEKLEGDKK